MHDHRIENCRLVSWPFELDSAGRFLIPTVDELLEDDFELPMAECARRRFSEMSDEQLRRHDDWVELMLTLCILEVADA